ncbi:MAG: hypothetical protein ABIL58_19215 [Pseudomonadota bacterium]
MERFYHSGSNARSGLRKTVLNNRQGNLACGMPAQGEYMIQRIKTAAATAAHKGEDAS